jgi:hypothetical protein
MDNGVRDVEVAVNPILALMILFRVSLYRRVIWGDTTWLLSCNKERMGLRWVG